MQGRQRWMFMWQDMHLMMLILLILCLILITQQVSIQPTGKLAAPVQLDYGDYRGNYNNKSGRASAIAVSGNNVYVAGFGTWFSPTSGLLPYGVFWKNGIPLDQDSMNLFETRELYSLAVSNNDTYMVGWGAKQDTGKTKIR